MANAKKCDRCNTIYGYLKEHKCTGTSELYISVDDVKNEIRQVIKENERFILGRSDNTEVYAGEVALSQLRRLLRKFENPTGLHMILSRKAEWIGEKLGICRCSSCNYKVFICKPFCPNCGADMRKEETHE